MTTFQLLRSELALWTIVVGVVCNVSCALVGCYLVLRRLSLLGDAISHAILPGIVLAFLLTGEITGWPIILGAMALGVLTALLTQALCQFGDVPEDSSMGVVFTSLFALGVVLIARAAYHTHLDADCVFHGKIEFVALPGNTETILGVEVPWVLRTMAPVLVLTIAFIILLWKELKITSFDPALATALGINATLVHYLLMALVAGVTVSAFEAVGAILVVAMLIVPGATAHLLTDRLGTMMLGAALVAMLSAVLGYVGAVLANTSVAGMMAVMAGGQFLLAVLFAPRQGLCAKLLRNLKLMLRIQGEDYLGLLYRLAEARQQGADPETLARIRATWPAPRGWLGWLAVRGLRWQGALRRGADETPQLTEAGWKRAASLVRAHRLWETYLEENLPLPADHLHEPAHRMEHFLSPELQRDLEEQLRHPPVDPHGKTIPPG
ncbi:MAG: metal ABC transporter permease [Gemmataceae bacterium]